MADGDITSCSGLRLGSRTRPRGECFGRDLADDKKIEMATGLMGHWGWPRIAFIPFRVLLKKDALNIM